MLAATAKMMPRTQQVSTNRPVRTQPTMIPASASPSPSSPSGSPPSARCRLGRGRRPDASFSLPPSQAPPRAAARGCGPRRSARSGGDAPAACGDTTCGDGISRDVGYRSDRFSGIGPPRTVTNPWHTGRDARSPAYGRIGCAGADFRPTSDPRHTDRPGRSVSFVDATDGHRPGRHPDHRGGRRARAGRGILLG